MLSFRLTCTSNAAGGELDSCSRVSLETETSVVNGEFIIDKGLLYLGLFEGGDLFVACSIVEHLRFLWRLKSNSSSDSSESPAPSSSLFVWSRVALSLMRYSLNWINFFAITDVSFSNWFTLCHYGDACTKVGALGGGFICSFKFSNDDMRRL